MINRKRYEDFNHHQSAANLCVSVSEMYTYLYVQKGWCKCNKQKEKEEVVSDMYDKNSVYVRFFKHHQNHSRISNQHPSIYASMENQRDCKKASRNRRRQVFKV
jgi:hypothetical protein